MSNKKIPPGRELDAAIAEKFFNLTVVRNKKGGWSLGPAEYYDSYGEMILSNPLPDYSTDIASAWEIINKLKETLRVTVTSLEPISGTRFYCSIVRHNGMGDFSEWQENGESEAHSICLCTLKMMEEVITEDSEAECPHVETTGSCPHCGEELGGREPSDDWQKTACDNIQKAPNIAQSQEKCVHANCGNVATTFCHVCSNGFCSKHLEHTCY